MPPTSDNLAYQPPIGIDPGSGSSTPPAESAYSTPAPGTVVHPTPAEPSGVPAAARSIDPMSVAANPAPFAPVAATPSADVPSPAGSPSFGETLAATPASAPVAAAAPLPPLAATVPDPVTLQAAPIDGAAAALPPMASPPVTPAATSPGPLPRPRAPRSLLTLLAAAPVLVALVVGGWFTVNAIRHATAPHSTPISFLNLSNVKAVGTLPPTYVSAAGVAATHVQAGSLVVTGASQLQGAANIQGNLSVGNNLTVGGSATVGGTVSATSFLGSGAALTGLNAAACADCVALQHISIPTAQVGNVNIQGSVQVSSLSSSTATTNSLSAATIVGSGSGLTVGDSTQALLLQGAGVTVTNASGGQTTSLSFTGSPAGDVSYTLDRSVAGGTYAICTTASNACTANGIQSSSPGTAGFVTKFTSPTTVADSIIYDNGTDVGIGTSTPGSTLDVAGNINTSGSYLVNGTAISSSNLTNGSDLAKLDANQTFTGNNTFTGDFKAQNATNSTTPYTFQVQNAAGNDNLLIGDTVNTRIGIGVAAPQYTLDVGGDVNIANNQSYRINGVVVCSNVGCNPNGGSNAYVQIQASSPGVPQSGSLNVSGTATAGTFSGSGIDLTNLDASQVATGTLNDLRLSGDVTLQGNTFNGASQLVQTTGLSYFPALNGSLITNLDASNVTTGTLGDGLLSSNVALLNGTGPQTFTGNDEFTGTVLAKDTSTTAFEVQNASASPVLVADTSNLKVGIGAAPSSGGSTLQVSGNISATTIYQSGNQVCDASGNCVGGGGPGGAVGGSGTTNDIALFTNTGTIGNSILTQASTTVTAAGSLNVTGAYEQGGTSGEVVTCTSGNVLANTIVAGGIITSGSCVSNGGGSSPTLQQIYNNSTPASLTVSSTNGGVTIQDAATPIGGNLLAVKSNGGGTTYLAVTATGLSVTGNITTSGQYQVGGVQIASSNLSDGANLAKLNGTQSFTGNNTFTGTVLDKNASDSTAAFEIQNHATSTPLFVADTTNGRIGVGVQPAYTLDVNGDLNIASGSEYSIGGTPICGPSATCAPSSGSNSYVQNGVSLQSNANFDIQSTATGSVVAVLNGKSGQSADLLDARDGSGNLVASIGNQGQTLFEDSSAGSATFFQIQNSSTVPLFVANTTSGQILLPNANLSSTALVLGGDANLYRSAASTLKTDGNLVVAGNLTDNGQALFENASNSNTAFQVQNSSGTNIFTVDTSNSKIGTADSTSVSTQPLTIQTGNASSGSNLSSGNLTIDTGTKTGVGTTGSITIGGTNASSTTLGRSGATTTLNGNTSSSIALGNFTVSAAGAIVGVGVNSGTGLIQGTGGLTVQGATTINSSGSANTSIGQGSSGTIGIGNGSSGAISIQSGSTLAITTTNLNLSTAGVLTLAGAQTADITTAAAGVANALTFQPGISSTATDTGASFTLQGGNESGTTGGVGGTATLQGGNATGSSGTRTGGNVVIDAGTGATANGNVNIGTTNSVTTTLGRSGGITTINGNSSSTISFTNFAVSAAGVLTLAGSQAADITTATAGTANTLTFQPGISSVATGTGATLAIQGGNQSGTTTAVGGQLTLQGGNVTGASGSRTGGTVVLDAGTGATANGNINIGTTNSVVTTLGRTGGTTTINGGASSAITFTNFTVSAAGAIVGVGVNSGTGLIQGTGGLTITSGAATIGTGGNTAVFASGTGQVTYSGSARHTKKIILTPEYAGAVLDSGGAGNDIGTMTAGFDSTQRESYYQWTTAQSSNQVYDVVAQVPVPSDFSAWATTTPITVDVKTSDTTNGTVTAKLFDTTGTIESAWNTCSLTPGSNSWTTETGCTVAGTYTANGVLTLRLILQAPQSGTTEIGNITLSYLSSF